MCSRVDMDGVGRGVERVDPAVADAAARFGDEPVVIAQRTGVPVWVGAERFAAGTLAEAEGGERGVHLLDDGFQHRGLARVMDVVLVTEEDLDDALLPAGNLREPLSALTRADVVVVREEERERVEPRIRRSRSRGRGDVVGSAGVADCGCVGMWVPEAGGLLRDCPASGVFGDAGEGCLSCDCDGGLRGS